jgi:hypothetical protein
MTVLRREDVQSGGASWDSCPCRRVRAPILTIVPLIIRRLRGPLMARVITSVVPLICLSTLGIDTSFRLLEGPAASCAA